MTNLDLATWLLEQIADDERIAREGLSNQADPEHGWGTADVEVANPAGMRPAVKVQLAVTPHVAIVHESVQRDHIVRWHPGRVLAECDAKREILDVTSGTYSSDLVHRLMALPYADRPGYREEWRPEA